MGMEVSVRMPYAWSCVQFVSTSGAVSDMSCMHELENTPPKTSSWLSVQWCTIPCYKFYSTKVGEVTFEARGPKQQLNPPPTQSRSFKQGVVKKVGWA